MFFIQLSHPKSMAGDTPTWLGGYAECESQSGFQERDNSRLEIVLPGETGEGDTWSLRSSIRNVAS